MSNFKIAFRNVNLCPFKTIWAHFKWPSSNWLRLTCYLNINVIQILPLYICLRYLQVDWTGVMLMDDMWQFIKLPVKGQILTRELPSWVEGLLYVEILGGLILWACRYYCFCILFFCGIMCMSLFMEVLSLCWNIFFRMVSVLWPVSYLTFMFGDNFAVHIMLCRLICLFMLVLFLCIFCVGIFVEDDLLVKYLLCRVCLFLWHTSQHHVCSG